MSELIIIQAEEIKSFKMISLMATEDPRLSWEAKGLHTYMISRPPNWKIYFNDLLNRSTCGRDKLRKLLSELEDFGYLTTEQLRDEYTNQFSGKVYKVYQSPITEKPSPENPSAGKPSTETPLPENPPLNNKESTIKEKNKKEENTSIVHHNARPTDQNQLSLFSDQEFEAELQRRTGDPDLRLSKSSDIERSHVPAACGKVDNSGKKVLPRGGHAPDAFAAFWAQYPVKKAKDKAQSAWNRLKANSELISTIMHDIANRKQNDRQWVEGFVPHASTYLNGQRWEDEIEPLTNKKTGVQSSQSGKPTEEEQMAYLRSYLND